MDNPLLKTVMVNFPDVDAASLPWPAGATEWSAKDLELFIGSGGFLKPKAKKKAEPAAAAGYAGGDKEKSAPAAPAAASGPTKVAQKASSADGEELPSSFEVPGWSKERMAITMPVHVHCEDTAPHGHVRIESLTAFSERIRSLALKQIMNCSLADLKERKLAILATEYVVEIVGSQIRVLDTMRIDTAPEFPAAPLFPWETEIFGEDGSLYMHGRFGLNLCQISDAGVYSGIEQKGYDDFVKTLRKFSNPAKAKFSPTSLRFFTAYDLAGKPFTPTEKLEVGYTVRGADCDMYNVLFQARVPSMMESCLERYDALAYYVNIRQSVRPGDKFAVHIFTTSDSALFICLRGAEPVLTAFGHYGTQRPMTQEEIKCASMRLPVILTFVKGGKKPAACADFDFSNV